MSTEQPTYLARPADRLLNSFRIACETYAITLTAGLNGRLRVHVATLPAPGRDYGGSLTNNDDGPADFAIGEITLSDDRLECLAAPRWGHAPYFRTGFAVDLEPGMHDAIAEALKQLRRVATASDRVRDVLDGLLAGNEDVPEHQRQVDGFNYMHGAVEEAIAAVVLDGERPEAAADRGFKPFESGSGWEATGRRFKDCVIRAIEGAAIA